MKHFSEVDGKTYKIGKVYSYIDNENLEMIVVLENKPNPVILDFYHGKYDYKRTERIIQEHPE